MGMCCADNKHTETREGATLVVIYQTNSVCQREEVSCNYRFENFGNCLQEDNDTE